jgi:23S rRNA pseudouridine1911/1915/1917 synthase
MNWVSERIESFSFDKEQEERLDHFLVRKLSEFSRSRLQNLIKEGFVNVNGIPVKKTGQKLELGQTIEITIPAPVPSELVGEQIPLDIVYESEDVLIVDKPAGMVVHPAAGHFSGTLVHAVLGYIPEIEGIGGQERPGIVHRLDKDTSGLIVLAKNDRAHHWLQDQFRTRKVEKTYLALVDGKPPTPNGRVDAPIGRDPSHRKRMAIMPAGKGRAAVSEYFTLEPFDGHTLLEFHPNTGRTHQIRLHCAFLGCPIVGDKVYGRRKPTLPLARHFLHASKIEIMLPGEQQTRVFESILPDELDRLLGGLRS